ncbi:MAG TPA: flagellar biosynthetic protein FliO [Terriglobales bacterium]|jgi:flagellar biogenesis protein FliO
MSQLHSELFPQKRWMKVFAGLRRRFTKGPARLLRVRETLTLGEKRQLLLLDCGKRRLLIGTAGNYIAKIAELPVENTRSEGART